MTRFLSLFLLLAYTTAFGGVPVFLQHCKEQVVDVRLGESQGGDCKKDCPTEKPGKKCCKITQQKLQSAKSNDSSLAGISKPIPLALPPADFLKTLPFHYTSIEVEHTQSNGPPLAGKPALYLQNCSLII